MPGRPTDPRIWCAMRQVKVLSLAGPGAQPSPVAPVPFRFGWCKDACPAPLTCGSGRSTKRGCSLSLSGSIGARMRVLILSLAYPAAQPSAVAPSPFSGRVVQRCVSCPSHLWVRVLNRAHLPLPLFGSSGTRMRVLRLSLAGPGAQPSPVVPSLFSGSVGARLRVLTLNLAGPGAQQRAASPALLRFRRCNRAQLYPLLFQTRNAPGNSYPRPFSQPELQEGPVRHRAISIRR